ncbi:hypothetical protein [Nocardioides mesophilus]|uniref:Uncharacterized protein n=1 Tax=Nocardioides mesophilus TaxID=433659 RepID=A0A7G9R985_9ACTN|nr:hypothetical protein [Nocardioides mesophilus]QNN52160.1 hypothetical protein H9L09_16910 [Nocardioides mesophilus]
MTSTSGARAAGPRPVPETASGLRIAPQRRTPCLARLDRSRVWRPTRAVRVGQRVVGVRTTGDESADSVVEGLLRPRRVPTLDGVVPAHFSVELAVADRTAAPRRGLHLVYRDHEVVARRREPERLLADLLDLLDSAGHPDTVGLLAVRATAVVRGSTAVLLPEVWHGRLLLHQERLLAEGLDLRTARSHLLDVDALELVDRSRPTRAVRLGSWVLRTAEDAERIRPALAVQAGFGSVVNADTLGAGSALRMLAAVLTEVPAGAVGAVPDSALVDRVRGLAHHPGRAAGGRPPRGVAVGEPRAQTQMTPAT